MTKASAFARSAVGGLRCGGGTKAVAAVRQSSACRMAEGRVDGVSSSDLAPDFALSLGIGHRRAMTALNAPFFEAADLWVVG